jgi:RNA polymerase sigma-70 factor (ECF subfamily)
MGSSDIDLARRAAAGDSGAFRELLERHYDLLYRLAYRFFGNRADAEDVAQDVCLALAVRIRGFEGKSRLSTWLYRVAVNACRDHARRQANIRALHGASAAFVEHQRADWADSEGKVRWLYEAIGALDPSLQETALLVLTEDLNHRDAGEVLGVAEATVSWRMHKVKERLKALAESCHE